MSFTLSAETIGQLGNGNAADRINRALREMLADTDARGDDEQPRKVIVEIDMHKTAEGSVSFGVNVSWKMPKLSVPRVIGDLGRRGWVLTVEIDDESESERAA